MSDSIQNPQTPQPAPAPLPPRRSRGLIWGLGLVAAVAGIGYAAAQMSGGGWRDGGGWREHRGWGGGHHGMMGGMDRRERFAQFCGNDTARYHPVVRAFAKADLRLNDSQSKEFDALVDTVLPALEGVKREACNNFVSMTGAPPERLAQVAGVLRKAADAAEKATEPTKKFYASLDDTQKARVNELMERRRMHR
jgi:hypothetical protein